MDNPTLHHTVLLWYEVVYTILEANVRDQKLAANEQQTKLDQCSPP